MTLPSRTPLRLRRTPEPCISLRAAAAQPPAGQGPKLAMKPQMRCCATPGSACACRRPALPWYEARLTRLLFGVGHLCGLAAKQNILGATQTTCRASMSASKLKQKRPCCFAVPQKELEQTRGA